MTKLCIGAVIIIDPRQTFSQKLTAPRRRSSAHFSPLHCCYHYRIIGRSRSSIDKPGGSVAIGRFPLAFLDLRPSRRAASKTSGEGERDLDLDSPWRAEWRRNLGRKSIERAVPEVSAMGAEAGKKGGVIALFDVDGTLTPARKEASTEMLKFLQDLRKVVSVGVVGGSDLIKISEQLGKNTTSDYDYVFSENGLVAYKSGKLIGSQSLKAHLGEEKLKKFLNFVLHYVADLDIPIKRGTFIEFRMGMLNVSPIGRNCSYEEREEFERYDKVHNVRSKFVEVLKEKFADYSLTYSIGGQISFDVFPRGWDKTFCLSFVEKEFNEIHFFGDKTYKGGNDHEIFESEKTIGHTVTSPEDTRKQCTKLFL